MGIIMSRSNLTDKSNSLRLILELSSRNKRIFTIEDARSILDINDHQLRKLLYRLKKRNWIENIERGKYMIIPLEAGVEREWTEDVYTIAPYITSPYALAYRSALSYWNLTEQIPRDVYIQTTRRKNKMEKEILGVKYKCIIIKKYKMFGITEEETEDGKFKITNIEKTFIDSLDRPDLSGSFYEIIKALQTAGSNLDLNKAVLYTEKMKNRALLKRLGYLCEFFGIGEKEFWDKANKKISGGYAYLDLSSNKDENSRNSRWRIIINTPPKALKKMRKNDRR